MSLVDTSKVNDLAARIQDLLTGLSPEEVKAVVANVNTQLADLGVVLQHVDDVAGAAKVDLVQVGQALTQLTGIMTKADAVLDRLSNLSGVQLVFRDDAPKA
jgi:hypothetical protein